MHDLDLVMFSKGFKDPVGIVLCKNVLDGITQPPSLPRKVANACQGVKDHHKTKLKIVELWVHNNKSGIVLVC